MDKIAHTTTGCVAVSYRPRAVRPQPKEGTEPLANGTNGRRNISISESAPCIAKHPRVDDPTRCVVSIRELRASDAQACYVFFKHLHPDDVRMRFASPRAYSFSLFLPCIAGRSLAFAAVNAADMIVGVANLVHLSPSTAETALAVRSDHKRRGIGRSLLGQVLRHAEEDGLSQLSGSVLADNKEMLAFAEAMGWRRIGRNGLFIIVGRQISSTGIENRWAVGSEAKCRE
jgi:GNAT superfamily N-acetyltransferase